MNATTTELLNKAKEAGGTLVSKEHFLKSVKDIFSPDAELPASRPNPDWLDCPLVSYEIRQPRDYPMANPFRTLLEWFGIDESKGYAVVAGCLYGSAGTGEDLEASFKRAIENKYALVR